MGSTISRIDDQLNDEEIERNREYLERIAYRVKNTDPYGSKFEDRKWLEDNKNKILRNKGLIDLLG